MLTQKGAPLVQPRGALGDGPSGAFLAGGVAAALFRRERTGEADPRRRVAARRGGVDAVERPRADDDPAGRTAASRRGQEPRQRARRLVPHRRRTLDQPEHARSRTALGADVPRARPRRPHRPAGVRDAPRSAPSASPELHPIFVERIGSLTLADLKARLSAHDTIYSPIASPVEVIDDPQVIANGYLAPHPDAPNGAARVVADAVRRAGPRSTARRARRSASTPTRCCARSESTTRRSTRCTRAGSIA